MKATRLSFVLLALIWAAVDAVDYQNQKLFKRVISELNEEIRRKVIDHLVAIHREDKVEEAKVRYIEDYWHSIQILEKDVFGIDGNIDVAGRYYRISVRKPFHGKAELISLADFDGTNILQDYQESHVL